MCIQETTKFRLCFLEVFQQILTGTFFITGCGQRIGDCMNVGRTMLMQGVPHRAIST